MCQHLYFPSEHMKLPCRKYITVHARDVQARKVKGAAAEAAMRVGFWILVCFLQLLSD